MTLNGLKLILVANMSLNGLTRGLKTICNKPKPSLEVTQRVKRWGNCLQLNSLIELSFIYIWIKINIKNTSMFYVKKNMHTLTDLSEHAL